MKGSQINIFPTKVVGWPDPKHGLERMLIDDSCMLYTETCIIC